MKRILITGINSYLGNAIEQYLMEKNASLGEEQYHVDKISLKEEVWRYHSFEGYDAILHVAGIAHADIGNVSQETRELYYQVNCGLTLAVAQKAKAEGVPQFIYFSSVIVYGESGTRRQAKMITAQTAPKPANFYGDSKYQAELGLQKLCEEAGETPEAERFRVAILRLPMIYGRGSRGNFPMLVKMAERLPVFPAVSNQRSMLYVENLAEFVRLLIERGGGGVFFPQNAEYVSTAELVRMIGKVRGKRIYLWKILNPAVALGSHIPGKVSGMVNKAFGSLTIDRELSRGEIRDYQIYDLEESIKKSVMDE